MTSEESQGEPPSKDARLHDASQASTGRSLPLAIATAVVLIGLLALFNWLGAGAFFGLIAVVVLIALFELLDALVQAGRRPVIVFGLACGLALMWVVFLERYRLISLVVAGAAFGSLLLALRPTRGATPSSDAAWTVFGVAWIAGGGAAATAILHLDGGQALLVGSILTIALDDITAYFVGTKFGRHKMAPTISPAKSWEGFAGGVAGALVAGVVFGLLVEELGPVHGLAVGVLCGLLAPAGDLVESLAKRELGIKDSGRLLPGHGGFLDRVDAMLFCAPFVFVYLRFIAV